MKKRDILAITAIAAGIITGHIPAVITAYIIMSVLSGIKMLTK